MDSSKGVEKEEPVNNKKLYGVLEVYKFKIYFRDDRVINKLRY